MIDQNASEAQEKFIAEQFSSLPRIEISQGNKETVWLTIQTQIRTARKTVDKSYGWRFSFLRILATGLVIMIALTIVGGAARAMPGETLYPIKKAAEEVEKVLAPTAEARIKVSIKHAHRRLEEVQTLVSQNKEPKIVAQTLEDLKNTTKEIVQVSADKPELKDNAVKLTQEETQVLDSVNNNAPVENQVVKTAISQTRQSIDELVSKTSGSDVKGAGSTEGSDTDTTTAVQSPTSTAASLISPAKSRAAEKSQQSIKNPSLDASLQVGDIIKIENGDVIKNPDPLPPPNNSGE